MDIDDCVNTSEDSEDGAYSSSSKSTNDAVNDPPVNDNIVHFADKSSEVKK